MEGKRFVYGRVMSINSNDSLPCITDSQDGKDYIKFVDVVDLLNSLNDENQELNEFKNKLFRLINDNIEIYENINTNVEFHRGEINGKLTLLYNLKNELLKW